MDERNVLTSRFLTGADNNPQHYCPGHVYGGSNDGLDLDTTTNGEKKENGKFRQAAKGTV